MNEKGTRVRSLSSIPLLIVCVAVVTFVTTLCLYFALHRSNDRFIPYLSETGVYFPESFIFRVGLNTIALLSAVLFIAVYNYYTTNFPSSAPTSKLTLQITLIGCVLLSFTGTCSMGDNGVMHGTCAGLFFISLYTGSILWHRIDKLHGECSSHGEKKRIIAFSVALLVMIIYALLFVLLFWNAVREDVSKNIAHSIRAAIEYTLVFLLVVICYSFRRILISSSLHVKSSEKKSPLDSSSSLITYGAV